MVEVSVVVPVYQNEKSLKQLLDKLKFCLETNYKTYEIICVDDGSTDKSAEILGEIEAVYEHLTVVYFPNNKGQQMASFAGLKRANGKVIVTIDADLQQDPSHIKALVDNILGGYDLCYGVPVSPKRPIYKSFGSLLRDMLMNMFPNKPKNVKVSSFRAMNYKLKNKIIVDNTPFVYLSAMAFKHKISVSNVHYKYAHRVYGKSTYTFVKLVVIYLKLIYYYKIRE